MERYDDRNDACGFEHLVDLAINPLDGCVGGGSARRKEKERANRKAQDH